jgi:hypothetical protein
MEQPPPPAKGTLIIKVKITTTLLDYFTGRRRVAGLPADAELISWWRHPTFTGEARLQDEWICFKVEHESFPIPAPGTRYTEAEPLTEIVAPPFLR